MKATINQIRKAINRDNDMVVNHQGAIYFLGDYSRKERIKQNLASNIYYDECAKLGAFGCYEIYNLILNKKLPKDIVKFFVETKNGGGTELNIIALVYGIGKAYYKTMQEVFEYNLSLLPDHEAWIRDCFKGFVKNVSMKKRRTLIYS